MSMIKKMIPSLPIIPQELNPEEALKSTQNTASRTVSSALTGGQSSFGDFADPAALLMDFVQKQNGSLSRGAWSRLRGSLPMRFMGGTASVVRGSGPVICAKPGPAETEPAKGPEKTVCAKPGTPVTNTAEAVISTLTSAASPDKVLGEFLEECELPTSPENMDALIDELFPAESIADCLDGIKDGIEGFGSDIKDGIEGLGSDIKEGFEDLGSDIKEGFEDFGSDIKEGFEDFGSDIKDGIEGFGSDLKDGFGSAVGSVLGGGGGLFGGGVVAMKKPGT